MKIQAIFVLCFSLFLFSCHSEITVKDIIVKSEQASFIIYTYDEYGVPSGSGSGFFIKSSGVGITNYHVLDGATKSIIITADSSQFEIDRVISASKEKDILTFQINNPESKIFKTLGISEIRPEKGDEIFCISNPLRLENTFSSGIISNLRKKDNGVSMIQFTAPISPGSSGGALLNEHGEVIAVATYTQQDGQNLNFGTFINNEILNSIKEDDFSNRNPKFSKRENFIIVNLKSDNDPFTVLNAIEFGENATTFYMSFTNLHVSSGNGTWAIYNKFEDDKEENLYITDVETNTKYHLVSSSLGTLENPTSVPLGTTTRYKQHFPKFNSKINTLSIGDINQSTSPYWTNINLDDHREIEKFDINKFQTQFAFSAIKEGNYLDAYAMFQNILDDAPESNEALNILGVLEYILGNYSDALSYYTRAINSNPNTAVTYVNRHFVYQLQGDTQAAIDDLTKAINISPNQADFYLMREQLYLSMGNKENARKDFLKADDIYAKDLNRESVLSWGYDEERVYDYILKLRNQQK